jgi:hypothetical protein
MDKYETKEILMDEGGPMHYLDSMEEEKHVEEDNMNMNLDLSDNQGVYEDQIL